MCASIGSPFWYEIDRLIANDTINPLVHVLITFQEEVGGLEQIHYRNSEAIVSKNVTFFALSGVDYDKSYTNLTCKKRLVNLHRVSVC